jgi:hypothetical protein
LATGYQQLKEICQQLAANSWLYSLFEVLPLSQSNQLLQ